MGTCQTFGWSHRERISTEQPQISYTCLLIFSIPFKVDANTGVLSVQRLFDTRGEQMRYGKGESCDL